MKYMIVFFLMIAAAAPSLVGQIEWMSWEEMEAAQKREPRKVMVDLYSENCVWCKKMDETTLSNERIVEYVNQNFYAVKFSGEHTGPINFNGKKYVYKRSGDRKYHELAAHLTRGNLSYPTMIFLDTDHSVLQAVPGYQRSEVFEQIITYFNEDHHRRTPWNAYQRAYVPLDHRE